jgi:hypothetical protein
MPRWINCECQIDFRTIDDIVRPLGCTCGGRVEIPPRRRNPGEVRTAITKCFWCSLDVFYHTNGNGDCVLFDALGRPWAVHGCWKEYTTDRHRAAEELDRRLDGEVTTDWKLTGAELQDVLDQVDPTAYYRPTRPGPLPDLIGDLPPGLGPCTAPKLDHTACGAPGVEKRGEHVLCSFHSKQLGRCTEKKRDGKRCWNQGVVAAGDRVFCRTHASKRGISSRSPIPE